MVLHPDSAVPDGHEGYDLKIPNSASLLLCGRMLLRQTTYELSKIVFHPNSAVPDGHEGYAKEEAEDAAHLEEG